MRGPIGYVAADVGGRTPKQVVELLAEAGYGAVDWTMEQFDPLRDPPERLAELVVLARAAGLQVAQLMVHQDYVTPERELWERRVRRSEGAVAACAYAGIESIGVLTGPNLWEPGAARIGHDIDEQDAWECARLALARVLDRAEEYGVRVALEPCWGTLAHGRYRAEYALALLLEHPSLAVNFDPSHHALCGDDVAGAVRAWGGRIAHVHLKDAVGRCYPGAGSGASAGPAAGAGPRSGVGPAAGAGTGSGAGARVGPMEGEDFAFLLPGEGAVPWRALFDALDAIGYTGTMSVENEARPLLQGPLRGDLARAAGLARELVAGLLGED